MSQEKEIENLKQEIERLRKQIPKPKPKPGRKVCSEPDCSKHTYKDKCRQHSGKKCARPDCNKGSWNEYCSKHSEHTLELKRQAAQRQRERAKLLKAQASIEQSHQPQEAN